MNIPFAIRSRLQVPTDRCHVKLNCKNRIRINLKTLDEKVSYLRELVQQHEAGERAVVQQLRGERGEPLGEGLQHREGHATRARAYLRHRFEDYLRVFVCRP